jgi:hypothetical protein
VSLDVSSRRGLDAEVSVSIRELAKTDPQARPKLLEKHHEFDSLPAEAAPSIVASSGV